MKFFLLGKTGQLGKAFDTLATKDHTLFSYSHSELDILDFEKVAAEIKRTKPDIIINASAYHVVPECDLYPENAFAINSIAIKKVAEICQENAIQFVHFSTDYVFDGKKGSPYTENDAVNPLQTYGISKYAGEQLALLYNTNSIIIRTSGVYGGNTGSNAKKGNFVITMLNQTKGKEILEVSSEQIVSPTYAEDLAEATLLLLEKNPAHGVYHLVNQGYCSWAEFASEIVRIKQIPCEIVPIDRSGISDNTRRPLFSALENKKANQMSVSLPLWQDALTRYLTKYFS